MDNKKQTDVARQSLTEKILLHLANCADFGFSYTFSKRMGFSQFPGKALRSLIKTNEKNFSNSIAELKRSKFIYKKKGYNGSILISLTEKGKLRALNIRFRRLANKKERWDGKWRMVAFDIPNEFRKGRDALHYRMRMGGFYELQESLFLYPYDCKEEVGDFIKLFKLENYVRFGLLDSIDIQDRLKVHFKLV